MDPTTLAVQHLTAADTSDIVAVLAEAFATYPVMRFVLGDDAEDADRLHRLVELFVTARVMRNEPLLGIRDAAGLLATAIASFPGRSEPPARFAAFRATVWQELGSDAEARYTAYGEAAATFVIDEPHTHLNMVGVLRRHQRSGMGRRLIAEVERISAADPDSKGVSLNTEDPRNVALYQHLGYEIIGHAPVAPGLETWGFFRRTP